MSLSPSASTDLHSEYFALDERSQLLMQIVAIAFTPLTYAQLRSHWKTICDRQVTPDEYSDVDTDLLLFWLPPKKDELKACAQSLVKQGLLEALSNQGLVCASPVLNIVCRDAVRKGVFSPIADGVLSPGSYPPDAMQIQSACVSIERFYKLARIALFKQDFPTVAGLFELGKKSQWLRNPQLTSFLAAVMTQPFDPNWIDSLTPELFSISLDAIFYESTKSLAPTEAPLELLQETRRAHRASHTLIYCLIEQYWLRGELQNATDLLSNYSVPSEIISSSVLSLSTEARFWTQKGAVTFLSTEAHQRPIKAVEQFQTGLKAAGKTKKQQSLWFEQTASILYFFALLAVGSTETLQEAERCTQLLEKQPRHWLKPALPLVFALVQQQQGKPANTAQRFRNYALTPNSLTTLLEIYCLHWLQVDDFEEKILPQLTSLCQQLYRSGYEWIALETAALLVHYQPEHPMFAKYVQKTRCSGGAASPSHLKSLPLLAAVTCKEPWELALDSLTALTQPVRTATPEPSLTDTYRLIWHLSFRTQDSWTLTPIEQKLSVNGGWTKGKKLPLKSLRSSYGQPAHLTGQDREVCEHIIAQPQPSYSLKRSPNYIFSPAAFLALVGHPHVYWADDPSVPAEIVEGAPELWVKRLDDDHIELSLWPPMGRKDIIIFKETPTRLKVIAVSEQHKQIATTLGPANRLRVPAQAEERVVSAIASIASLVTIQSDIGGSSQTETVPASTTPHVLLVPTGPGLKVSIRMRPFGNGGSYYVPGEGGSTVIAVIEGRPLQTQRDLTAERDRAEAVSQQCPVLMHYLPEAGEWIVDEPNDCLELLLQLGQLAEEVIVEWPEGEAFKVSREVSSSSLTFNIRKPKNWFTASGEVKVSDNQVLDMQQLMRLLENTPGKFIPLGNGEFVALTDEFRQRLQTLSRLSQRQGKTLRIHGLAAVALDDLIQDFQQEHIAKAWQSHIQQIKTAQTLKPKVPKALKTELRSYQKEGYVWLARLAEWGVGACLADDMGLGKTIQGLAILLRRAKQGPALVVAPTSVCMNWQSEAARFAPSLNTVQLGECDRAQRQSLLDRLGPQDLLLCSYGLLQQDSVAESLANLTWNTIILDEAQAIKNSGTKRSRAVMDLQGQFKIIMTGTPIENHLGELWNLFQFINPGLLGSLDQFKRRFANPIERDPGKPASACAREALRRLIRPFILRRTKDNVLKELPARTDITLAIPLSEEEMSFYEALRRDAITKLKKKKDTAAGQRHLQVLRELMRLRRACCHPSLVKPELAIPSAKLARFGELIAELLDNGHKALVFSQFVDHLKLLEAHLKEQQITYQYLDGSTPPKQRKQRVDAFQNGEGDLFLISLKAGGSGLNLTAADYVLHMDPWWNPAVEDQASDRAHRIGQQRPVTIYRLVAKATIEEKIVGLHQVKRDLADTLLAGADTSGKVSTDELLALIQA